ncbi:hypothetical protein J3458_000188 [Metarhizium acridum]|uniref:uncharacterized protein n=1 Tax=Metarhizium acridum TaxID=92637 RepID=UPI001C6C196F|nr:hypothetical protein J3458_000188 [Metarhizium acridum]
MYLWFGSFAAAFLVKSAACPFSSQAMAMATSRCLACTSITGWGFGLGHWAVEGRAGGLYEQLTAQSTIVLLSEVHLIGVRLGVERLGANDPGREHGDIGFCSSWVKLG